MQEIFKDIPGYKGLYQVSNLGNVKSLKRIDSNNHPIKERILKPQSRYDGYLVVKLSNSKLKKYKIHQLVAMAFLNHNPCGHKLVVDHKDFDRANNHLSNLKIITNRENTNLKHIKSTSKYTGVCWNKRQKKWISFIWIGYKNKYLGYFMNELEASRAYQTALNNL